MRATEEVFFLGQGFELSFPTVSSWIFALAWATFSLLVAFRLQSALPGLVTASLDADDEDVTGTKLDEDGHPALFRAVREVARQVGAPMPNEIWITADARCFACEQRVFGVSTQRVLVLALGLPHLLVMSAAELQLIIGHELAHVRQKDTTLAVFFFRFAHSLETYLAGVEQAYLGSLNLIAWLERFSAWLFKVLIGPVQRRQEILADCVSARVFGGDLARRTLIKDWLVTTQFTTLMEKRVYESHNGLAAEPRTLHQQFVDEWREVSASGREYLRKRLDQVEQESYYDSHPALNSRLRAVAAYPNFGIQDHQPAMGLLGDSDALIRSLGAELTSQLQHSSTQLAVAS